MKLYVFGGAVLTCSFGMAPAVLNVLPVSRVVSGTPQASVADTVPLVNIPSFGLCRCPSNPAVAAATAAALGVLTPAPCIPVPAGVWTPGNPKVLTGGKPALTADSRLMCIYGGTVQIGNPGTTAVSARE